MEEGGITDIVVIDMRTGEGVSFTQTAGTYRRGQDCYAHGEGSQIRDDCGNLQEVDAVDVTDAWVSNASQPSGHEFTLAVMVESM